MKAVITGSGGLSLSQLLEIPFEQEVVTCSAAVEKLIPETDVAIELGGEDAKITFLRTDGRAEDEWYVRGRNRSFYRSDGGSPEHGRGWSE